MASQSSAPPNPMDDNPQTSAPQVVQLGSGVQQDLKTEVVKENSTSVFVNSEPIREEQVQNAVKFLSHPKVRGSPIIYRRSFLEKKGLTKEEIDEAFRRVPDSSPTSSTMQPPVSNQDGQLKSLSNIQTHAQTQALQPASVPTSGSISKVGTIYKFHWPHAILAAGLLAVSGAGTTLLFKNSIIPRFKSWIRKVVFEEEEDLTKKSNSKPSLAEETAAAAMAAAAADVAQASQEMLTTKAEEKRCLEELLNLLYAQMSELKLMSNVVQRLEGPSNIPVRVPLSEHKVQKVSVTNTRQSYANGKADFDTHSVRSSLHPASNEPSVPHPKSYMELLAMVQRGERPPNIKEINDLPPNPNQPVLNPRLAPEPKPWEVVQAQNSTNYVPQYQESSGGLYWSQDNGPFNQMNGDGLLPWGQRKNVRITEIETEDEQKTASSGTLTNEQPVECLWVPPQPPPVAIPEAAAAIRQPKKQSSQREQLTDDQLLASSSEITDVLQRITKISESGGALEANGGDSGLSTKEIQKEDENSYPRPE